MSSIRHQNFRSFLTERFTAVAVEIFGEVEAIVEAYYEENKHLRNVLHMVLNPEIKIPKIDDIQHTRSTTDVRHPPPEPTSEIVAATSDPLSIQPKEEQMEYDISLGLAQQQGLGGAPNFFTPDHVKNDPDAEESSMSCLTELYNIQVVGDNIDTSDTISADEVIDEGGNLSSVDSDALADYPPLSGSEESTSDSLVSRNHDRKSAKKKKRTLQKTVLRLPRKMPYGTFIPPPADGQSLLVRLTEAFKDFPDEKKPLITKMGLTKNVEFPDCATVPLSRPYQAHEDAPPRPLLPLSLHMLEPLTDFTSLSAKELEHLNLMQITWEAAQSLESSTRPPHGHMELAEELRKLRMISLFREIRNLKPGQSYAEKLIVKIRKGLRRHETPQMEKEKNTEALQEYCHHVGVNCSPCGLVVHPYAPWLGALPDGLVYDPKETPIFGLVHIKCIRLQKFNDCEFLVWNDKVLQLKKGHSLYWHIQGEMMVTGMSWCDLLVFSSEDLLVQRIYRDDVVLGTLKEKLDNFFFHYYLPSLL